MQPLPPYDFITPLSFWIYCLLHPLQGPGDQHSLFLCVWQPYLLLIIAFAQYLSLCYLFTEGPYIIMYHLAQCLQGSACCSTNQNALPFGGRVSPCSPGLSEALSLSVPTSECRDYRCTTTPGFHVFLVLNEVLLHVCTIFASVVPVL